MYVRKKNICLYGKNTINILIQANIFFLKKGFLCIHILDFQNQNIFHRILEMHIKINQACKMLFHGNMNYASFFSRFKHNMREYAGEQTKRNLKKIMLCITIFIPDSFNFEKFVYCTETYFLI